MTLLKSIWSFLFWTWALFYICLASEDDESSEYGGWRIRWDEIPQRSFYQSETSPMHSIFFEDALEAFGIIWRHSILESLGILCLRHGPVLNYYIYNNTLDSPPRLICDTVTYLLRNGTSSISSTCNNLNFPPILDFEYNFFYILERCDVPFPCRSDGCPPPIIILAGCVVRVFGIEVEAFYNILHRWAPLFDDLLEWLGPSRIDPGNIFSICSALRYITGMETDIVFQKISNITTNVGADYLQYLQFNSSCAMNNESIPRYAPFAFKTLQAAYNVTGKSLCSEIDGAESREEFINLSGEAIKTLTSVIPSAQFCNYVHASLQYTPWTDDTNATVICDRLEESFSHMGTPPNYSTDPLVFAFIDAFGEMWRADTVADAVTVFCTMILSVAPNSTYSLGLMCRAYLDEGPEEFEDVCVQEEGFFEFVLGHSLRVRSWNSSVRAVEVEDLFLITLEWVRRVFGLQEVFTSQETFCNFTDDLIYRQSLETMLIPAIDVFLEALVVPTLETMCLDSYNFSSGVVNYIDALPTNRLSDVRVIELLTQLLPIILGTENSDDLCMVTLNNVDEYGYPSRKHIEGLRNLLMSSLTNRRECLQFMESVDVALNYAYGDPISVDFIIRALTGFRGYDSMCSKMVFYVEPTYYDFIVAISPAVSTPKRNERPIDVEVNFPYSYGSYWTYERAQFVGTGRTLPDLDLTIEAPSPAFEYLDILRDVKNRLEHVGVYVHTYHSNFHDKVVSIYSVIQSAGIVTFENPTKTVYLGEATTIGIANPGRNRRGRLRWRKDGRLIAKASGQTKLDLGEVDYDDAGIYEVHVSRRRSKGYQGIMRLIVPECPKDFYGAPSCDQHSYSSCYNGGVRRQDDSDSCICAYPFSGQYCQDEITSGSEDEEPPLDQCSGNSCKRKLFCRPDPFGCKCASGYTGKGCTKVCPQGRYGPSCEGTCHCDGDCNPVSGECFNACEKGVSGWNCQLIST